MQHEISLIGLRYLFLLISLSVPLSVFAKEASQDFMRAIKKIDSFEAQFVQKIRDANGEQMAKTKGEVVIQRPGKFYWKSQTPDPILVVADGTFLWTYDIDLSQVTKQDLHEAISNTPVALLADSISDLSHDFNVTYARKNQCEKKNTQCYALQPVKESAFTDIIIGFYQSDLTEIKMRDSLGQDVHMLFSNVKINHPVKNHLFSFVPPKGVDVIQAEN